MKLPPRLLQKLQDRKEAGNYRQLRTDRPRTDFCSNDYLGLSRSPALRSAVEQASQRYPDGPVGATGSRLLSGNFPLMETLEQELAAFHGAGSALLFNSGYAANMGFFSALPQRGDTIFYDEACHASMKDGFRLSFAKSYAFRHNSPADLRARLRLATGTVYVAIESLYSMDGDLAPLPEMAEICAEHGALLVVDEAHANGLFGPRGEGLVFEQGLTEKVFARILTFGKALGAHGAAVVGGTDLRPYLINFSRPFIYTTALPLHAILTIREAYRLLPDLGAERGKVRELALYLQQRLAAKVAFGPATQGSPIQALRIPEIPALKQAAAHLQELGFDVRPILAPTVPAGQEQLRVIVHAFNTRAEIDQLAQILLTYL